MKNINNKINPLILQNIPENNLFSGVDSEENFKKNLDIMPIDWHYRTKNIVYNVNKYGYRNKDFVDVDWASSIVVLGCSNIFGVGLAEDETFCYFLNKKTDIEVVNLGYASCSNELIVNNLACVINNFHIPKAIIIFWTSLDRLMFFHKNTTFNVGQWSLNKKNKHYAIFRKLLYDINISKENLCTKNYLLLKQAEAMCKNKTILFNYSFMFHTANELEIDFVKIDDFSRDLMHPGKESNKNIANEVSYRLKMNNIIK